MDRAFRLFTVAFKMVTEPNTRDAIWLEANGRKRYCAGPGGSGGCSASRTAAENAIADDINRDMLNLGASAKRRRGLNETISYRSKVNKVPLAGMVMMES